MNVSTPYFDENMPLRDGVPLNVTVRLADGTPQTRVIQSPVTNDVPGAMAIQQLFDNWEWVSQAGDPVAYAPHLRKDRLPGVPAKSVLIQFAKGDPLPVDPTTTAFLRAGDLADRATYYRYDLAFPGQNPNARPSPAYPHTFEALITSNNSIIQAVALGAQRQIATFLATDGEVIDNLADITLNGRQLFEVPIQGPLPEGLNFTIPASATASAEAQISGSQAPGPIPTAAATFEIDERGPDRAAGRPRHPGPAGRSLGNAHVAADRPGPRGPAAPRPARVRPRRRAAAARASPALSQGVVHCLPGCVHETHPPSSCS